MLKLPADAPERHAIRIMNPISEELSLMRTTLAASMINALDSEVSGSYAAAKWNISRSLFGDGSGKLATVTGAESVGANTKLTLDSVKCVIEGLCIDPCTDDLLVLNNRGTQIILGMSQGPFAKEGYTKEIHEIYVYEKIK